MSVLLSCASKALSAISHTVSYTKSSLSNSAQIIKEFASDLLLRGGSYCESEYYSSYSKHDLIKEISDGNFSLFETFFNTFDSESKTECIRLLFSKAVNDQKVDTIRYLIMKGFLPDKLMFNSDCCTSLDCLSRDGSLEALNVLLRNGFDPKTLTTPECNGLQHILKYKNIKLAELLAKYGLRFKDIPLDLKNLLKENIKNYEDGKIPDYMIDYLKDLGLNVLDLIIDHRTFDPSKLTPDYNNSVEDSPGIIMLGRQVARISDVLKNINASFSKELGTKLLIYFMLVKDFSSCNQILKKWEGDPDSLFREISTNQLLTCLRCVFMYKKNEADAWKLPIEQRMDSMTEDYKKYLMERGTFEKSILTLSSKEIKSTLLHYFTEIGNIDGCKLMLDRNVDPSEMNKEGISALLIAETRQDHELIKLMKKSTDDHLTIVNSDSQGAIIGRSLLFAIADLKKQGKNGWQEKAMTYIKNSRFSDPEKELSRLKTVGAFDIFPEKFFNLTYYLPTQIILGQAREIQKLYSDSHYVFFHAQSPERVTLNLHYKIQAQASGTQLEPQFKLMRPASFFNSQGVRAITRYTSGEKIRDCGDKAAQQDLISLSAHLLAEEKWESMLFFLKMAANVTGSDKLLLDNNIPENQVIQLKQLPQPKIGNLVILLIPKKTGLENLVYQARPGGTAITSTTKIEQLELLERQQKGELIENPSPQYRVILRNLDPKVDKIISLKPYPTKVNRDRKELVRNILQSKL